MKNNALDVFLIVVVILLMLDVNSVEIIPSNITIVAIGLIMFYLLTSGVIFRIREVTRIRNKNLPYWNYKKKTIDWSSLLFAFLFCYWSTQISGTMKIVMLIMGFQFLALLITNTILSRFCEFQLLALEGANIINIRVKLELLDLAKLKLENQTDTEIHFSGKWEKHKIIKSEFKNNEQMIEVILERLDTN